MTRNVKLLVVAAVVAALTAAAFAERPASTLTDAEKRKRIASLYRIYRQAKPMRGVPEVTVEKLLALRKKHGGKVVLVDARARRERAISTIPGAIPAARLERDPARYRGKTVVAYCTIGYRSGVLTRKLRQGGLEAYNLVGSILSWTHAGQRLVDAKGKTTRRLHVYGRTWDLAPATIKTQW